MARLNTPKFGNWDAEEDVTYTYYFGKVKKTKGGKMIDTMVLQGNQDMNPNGGPRRPALSYAPRLILEGIPRQPRQRPVQQPSDKKKSSHVPKFGDWEKLPDRDYFGQAKGLKMSNTMIPQDMNPNGDTRRPDVLSAPRHMSEDNIAGEYRDNRDNGQSSNPPIYDVASQRGTQYEKARVTPAPRSHDSSSHVPKFGDWDKLPDIDYFGQAKGLKMSNTMIPQDMNPSGDTRRPDVSSAPRPMSEDHIAGEYRDNGQSSNPPIYDVPSQRPAQYEIDRVTPARPQVNSAPRGDYSYDIGAAGPAFGDWNVIEPKSIKNFAELSNVVRLERHEEYAHALKQPSCSPRDRPSNKHKKCCFPWIFRCSWSS